MSTFLSKEMQEGLAAAHRLLARKRRSRLRVQVGDTKVPVLRFWNEGFSVDAEAAPKLRGLVDIYDGGRHIFQCLVVAAAEEGGEMRYDFKWARPATDQPPLDFARPDDAPAGLIARD